MRKFLYDSSADLYITQQIVEIHGGAIALEGALGQGTEFTVRLPLRHEKLEEKTPVTRGAISGR